MKLPIFEKPWIIR